VRSAETSGAPYLTPVPGSQLIIVSDAHLGATPPAVEEALLAFLEAVPQLGDSLLVNGDLFDFWFEYKRVIPRTGFRVAAALAHLRRKVPIVMVGGNHDRWGGEFWRQDLNIEFFPMRTQFTVGTRQVLAVHGDGLTEQHWSATLMHHLTRNALVVGTWRALHPTIGFWLADRMSHGLGNSTHDSAVLDRAAVRQKKWAEQALGDSPELGLVIMGHTHRPALIEVDRGRQYLNPGAWLDGFCYGVATETGAELRRFAG
jgi:UDP-2,3-diacylglucosamine hydrolase